MSAALLLVAAMITAASPARAAVTVHRGGTPPVATDSVIVRTLDASGVAVYRGSSPAQPLSASVRIAGSGILWLVDTAKRRLTACRLAEPDGSPARIGCLTGALPF